MTRPASTHQKAQQQVDERRLATARGTDEGKAHTWLGIDADILQQFAVGHIAKVHMLKVTSPCGAASSTASDASGLLLARIEQHEHAARRGVCGWDLRDDVGDLVERLGVLVGVGQEICTPPTVSAAGTPVITPAQPITATTA